MKGIVFDIKRFAVHDGPGIRTTVFLKGCPLSCYWCHNPESIDKKPVQTERKVKVESEFFTYTEQVGNIMYVDEVIDIVKRDKIFYEESGGGVTFSGGEPLIQPAFLKQLLKACWHEGIHTALDTCGYTQQEILEEIMHFTDLFLFDLKHIDSHKHKQSTGVPNEIIIKNLKYLLQMKKRIHIRIPVIPWFNFNENDMIEMMKLLQSLPGNIEKIDLLPYHTLGNNKYKRFGMTNYMEGVTALSKEDVSLIFHIFKNAGFNVSIGG